MEFRKVGHKGSGEHQIQPSYGNEAASGSGVASVDVGEGYLSGLERERLPVEFQTGIVDRAVEPVKSKVSWLTLALSGGGTIAGIVTGNPLVTGACGALFAKKLFEMARGAGVQEGAEQMRQEIIQNDQERVAYQEALKTLKSENHQLSGQVRREQKKNTELDELKSQLTQLQAQVKETEKQNQSLHKRVNKRSKRVTLLEAQQHGYERNLESSSDWLDASRDEVQLSKKQLKKQRKEHRQQMGAMHGHLQASQGKQKLLQSELRNLRSRLSGASRWNSNLRAVLRNTQHVTNEQKKELIKLSDDLVVSLTELKEQKERLKKAEQVSQEHHMSQTPPQSVRNQVFDQEAVTVFEALGEALGDDEMSFEQAQALIKTLQNNISVLNAQKDSRLEEARETLRQRDVEVSDLKEKVADQRKIVSSQYDEVEGLKNKVHERETSFEKLDELTSAQIARKDKQIKEQKKEIERLKHELSFQEEDLGDDIRLSKARAKRLENENSQLKTDLVGVHERLAQTLSLVDSDFPDNTKPMDLQHHATASGHGSTIHDSDTDVSWQERLGSVEAYARLGREILVGVFGNNASTGDVDIGEVGAELGKLSQRSEAWMKLMQQLHPDDNPDKYDPENILRNLSHLQHRAELLDKGYSALKEAGFSATEEQLVDLMVAVGQSKGMKQ